jgi:DNA-binding IclR family transcriptional regulator
MHRETMVDRVIDLQIKVDEQPEGLSLDDVAQVLGGTRRTAYRYIRALTRWHYRWKDGRLRRVRRRRA